jgi:hypothetical protein
MVLRVWLIVLVLLTGAQSMAAAEVAPPLYHQVAGGEERVEVAKRTSVTKLALSGECAGPWWSGKIT